MTQNEKSEDIKEDIDYWKKTANEFFEKGKYLEALEAYETVARLDPKSSEAWKGMGTAFYFLGKSYESLESLNKATKIDPNDQESLEIKGLILKKLLEKNEEDLKRLKAKKTDVSSESAASGE